MADRPILFSAPMVRALLAGTKTQTRRVLKPQPFEPFFCDGYWSDRGQIGADGEGEPKITRIDVGDRLWVRESLRVTDNDQGARWLSYAADGADVLPLQQWFKERNSVPSIHMPRRASRLTLTVTDVRVQRLQDISEADAIAEGVVKVRDACHVVRGVGYDTVGLCHTSAITAYAALWDNINGAGAWDANPWVAAYSFGVERRNIDAGA